MKPRRTSPSRPRAVVLLSGGLDSATCLAVARRDGFEPHTLSVDYGQRHREELSRARRLSAALGAASHRQVRVDLSVFGGSALTDPAIAVPKRRRPEAMAATIPVTYVPARNTVLLAVSTALAETLGARDVFVGVNAIDYSGYPDCRPAFLRAFERLARVATKAGVEGAPFRIQAPLLRLSKADIIRLGTALEVPYRLTSSCYDPVRGRACGQCDACQLRKKGFAEAGVEDPTLYVKDAAPREMRWRRSRRPTPERARTRST